MSCRRNVGRLKVWHPSFLDDKSVDGLSWNHPDVTSSSTVVKKESEKNTGTFVKGLERWDVLINLERLKNAVPNPSSSSHLKWVPKKSVSKWALKNRVKPVFEQKSCILLTTANITSSHWNIGLLPTLTSLHLKCTASSRGLEPNEDLPFLPPINHPLLPANASTSLPPIVIDGSNVAMCWVAYL